MVFSNNRRFCRQCGEGRKEEVGLKRWAGKLGRKLEGKHGQIDALKRAWKSGLNGLLAEPQHNKSYKGGFLHSFS
jgi:hypothetical protein